MSGTPSDIQPLLNEYTRLVHAKIPDLLLGVYLHGSIALGAFDPNRSDIDFIAILNRYPTSQELEHLKETHASLTSHFPRWQLEGSYVQVQDLGKNDDEPLTTPNIHDGLFREIGHFDLNAVTWWVLKHHGLTLFGPDPKDLKYDVSWSVVIQRMEENLHTYWKEWISTPRRLIALYSNWGVEWAVLGVLRLFYTSRENNITSKLGAGEYGMKHLPVKWHPLITEALQLRQGNHRSLYRSKLVRAFQTFLFLRYLISSITFDHQG